MTTADVVDDAAVVEQSRRHPELFATIYDRHFAGIYRYVASRLGPDAAEDLAAETFLAAFCDRSRFDPARGEVRPWLYGIATNLVGTHRRTERRRYRTLARAAAQPAAASDEERALARVSAQVLRGRLAEVLAALPAGDRDVLLLVAVGSLSYEEVSQALSIPPGTVGSRLNRARGRVRKAFGGVNPLGDDDDTGADHG
ncbi:MAG TPA: RNA polymerase sigma factor [Streptosporangiaceae bacterium]